MKVPKLPALLKDGYKMLQGVDEAVMRNIEACKQLGTLVKSSYGPNGMNKMVINHLEKLFVTHDAATIMKELEVAHPAAKLLVLASQQQEQEVGDETNWVVIVAAELLAKAENLLRLGLHTADIIEGYELAKQKATEILEEMCCEQASDVTDVNQLLKAVRPVIGSKQYGYDQFLAELVCKACVHIMPPSPRNFNVDSVRVVKVLGGSILDSKIVRGMVFNREAEGDIKNASKAKVAIFSCPLDTQHTETKGTVLLKSANELLSFSKEEEKHLEGMIKEIADSGVKIIVTGSGIGDMALHFVNRFGMMAIKVLSKFELRRLCKVTGATALTRLGAPMAEEMGYVDVCETIEIGSDRCTVFRQEDNLTRTVTLVLRGGTQNLLDDLERAVDDGVNAIKMMTRDNRLVAGAGAVEMSLARCLLEYGEKTPGVSALAIKAFAEALEVIPRTIAENAGLDATGVVSLLHAANAKGKPHFGVNIEGESTGLIGIAPSSIDDSVAVTKDVLLDSTPYQVLDPYIGKWWALKYASDAALTVLRVDQIIMAKPAGGPKLPKGGNAAYDEDDLA